jgi:hypothetical protein
MRFYLRRYLNIIKEDKVQLGRWNISYDLKELERKVYLANHDHCGPCGYLNDKKEIKKDDK